MSDEELKLSLFKEISSTLKGKIIVIYMTNGNRILGEIYDMTSIGIIMKNPVIINFNVNNSAIYMEDLYGGVSQSNVSLFPTTNIINFNLVIPYVESSYRKYIEDLESTRTSFLSEHDSSITNTTIH
jgi:hypothetical protein